VSNEDKIEKLCPFMVTEEYTHHTICEGLDMKTVVKSKTDRFKPCIKEKCMAYSDGDCKKL